MNFEESFYSMLMRFIDVEPVEDLSVILRFILMRVDEMIDRGMDEGEILKVLNREVIYYERPDS